MKINTPTIKTEPKDPTPNPAPKGGEEAVQKKKLPFWIKKEYLEKNKKPEVKPKKGSSIFKNTPFRDPDRGMIS
jgi:hypothetical protein